MSDRVELPDDVKRAIVQALACYDTPSDVAKAGRGRLRPRRVAAGGRALRPDQARRRHAVARDARHLRRDQGAAPDRDVPRSASRIAPSACAASSVIARPGREHGQRWRSPRSCSSRPRARWAAPSPTLLRFRAMGRVAPSHTASRSLSCGPKHEQRDNRSPRRQGRSGLTLPLRRGRFMLTGR